MATSRTEVEQAVLERYSRAAEAREANLCCPTAYDARYLDAIPEEILERDYGCGDPSKYLRRGETVLDLGSGGGKICYIAAQVVGPEGRVIGVDMNDEMLALAEAHREEVGDRLGFHNVTFHRGRIQELDMIASGTIDVVVSNCVLNLVPAEDKPRLFDEMFRVLEDDGRAVISDIVSSREVPVEMRQDPELWSGCLSGALRADRFLDAFRSAGFRETRVLTRGSDPWRTVEGIDFHSITVEAAKSRKAAGGCC